MNLIIYIYKALLGLLSFVHLEIYPTKEYRKLSSSLPGFSQMWPEQRAFKSAAPSAWNQLQNHLFMGWSHRVLHDIETATSGLWMLTVFIFLYLFISFVLKCLVLVHVDLVCGSEGRATYDPKTPYLVTWDWNSSTVTHYTFNCLFSAKTHDFCSRLLQASSLKCWEKEKICSYITFQWSDCCWGLFSQQSRYSGSSVDSRCSSVALICWW